MSDRLKNRYNQLEKRLKSLFTNCGDLWKSYEQKHNELQEVYSFLKLITSNLKNVSISMKKGENCDEVVEDMLNQLNVVISERESLDKMEQDKLSGLKAEQAKLMKRFEEIKSKISTNVDDTLKRYEVLDKKYTVVDDKKVRFEKQVNREKRKLDYLKEQKRKLLKKKIELEEQVRELKNREKRELEKRGDINKRLLATNVLRRDDLLARFKEQKEKERIEQQREQERRRYEREQQQREQMARKVRSRRKHFKRSGGGNKKSKRK